MTAELQFDVARDRRRPNVSGDLPTVFRAGPMFRRAVAGYDRFQVDTYVQWAEDELATADREREDLLARHLRTRAALDDARELLSHSAGGGDFLQMSRRVGALLATAADEAECIRTDADAYRSAASLQVLGMLAHARQVIANGEGEARRLVAEATATAGEMLAEAAGIVDEAERTSREARAESELRLAKVRVIEERAAEQAERLGRRAQEEAAAARLQARDDVVRLLATAREERRRADDAAAATRERLDADAADQVLSALAEVRALRRRRSSLRSEIRALERRQCALQAEVDRLADRPARAGLDLHVRQVLQSLRWRPPSLRAR
jgi:cell division septum initiation protein DivIVA